MAKQAKYSLLIICEGENTEPQFFNSIRDRIIEGKYPDVQDMEIRIRPEPKTDASATGEESQLKPTRKERKLLPGKTDIDAETKIPLPLKWVVAGQQELRDGTFNEVWVVFDNDNHPAKAAAFEKAKELINDKTINLAYSSIAFEYYLLLHFEKIYFAFEKSECRHGKTYIGCSSSDHEKDCKGVKCIGGYARTKGYWSNSKDNSSLFSLIKDKLEIGFWNAVWLRKMSEQKDGDKPFYDRNPFITTDAITKRLTGYDHDLYILNKGAEISYNDEILITLDNDFNLVILNNGNKTIVVKKECFIRRMLNGNDEENFGERSVLAPGEVAVFAIIQDLTQLHAYEYFFNYAKLKVLIYAKGMEG